VCIVYSIDDPLSFEAVTQYWLPEIERVLADRPAVPVILVGNKCDTAEKSSLDVSLAKVYDSSKIIDVAESPAIDERISSH
jgi:GTPase SAR1 family protein